MGNVVGIDLGTTYSAISRINKYGGPEIVTTGKSERMIPSVIYFTEEGKAYVGTEANENALKDQDTSRLVKLVKRHMGDDFFPKEIIGKKWAPAELAGLILAKIKKDYESQFGTIDKCVITVPAYFDEKRRQATVKAAEYAKLPLVGIINEPTAAALYYAKEHGISGKNMVFDLGGGTFDVTVLDVQFPQVEILASQGDPFLGGADFDLEIVNEAHHQNGKKIKISEFPDFDEFRFLKEAEDLKKILSDREKARGIYLGENFEISKDKFEKLIKEKFVKIEMLIESVLEELNLEPSDINNVVLVGGSSRIPLVKKLIKKIFEKEPLTIGNMDEAVALGASIYTGIKTADSPDASKYLTSQAIEELTNLNLTEVTTFAFSTASLQLNEFTKAHELMTSIIIPKNSIIPAKFTETFYTAIENQTKVQCRVLQGDGEYPSGVNEIISVELELPPNRPANQPIEITYEYDSNGMMKCTFRDVNSKTVKVIDLNMIDLNKTENNEDLKAYLDF
jgi:molecular chaperone DnaK